MSAKSQHFHFKILLIMLLITCSINSMHAQQANWQNFLVKWKGKPTSILVDLDLKRRNDLSRYPFLVVTGPTIKDCSHTGMPTAEDIVRLEEVLDVTDNFLTGLTAKITAGTVTYECQRLNYYYVRDTSGIRTAIARMYRRNFSNSDYVIKIKHEPAWSAYHEFLYPSDTLLNEWENNGIISNMLSQGDSLKGSRLISFAASFVTDSSRQNYIEDALKEGFERGIQKKIGKSSYPFCALVTLNRPIVTDTLNCASLKIKSLVDRHGGVYQQWFSPSKP